MATDVVCPACCEVGRSGTLTLRQINADEAVYVCENSQCPYPVGQNDLVVHNPVPELQPNAENQQENGKLARHTYSFDVVYLPLCTSLDLTSLEQDEQSADFANTLEGATFGEYEVNILLDPELDLLMEEL